MNSSNIIACVFAVLTAIFSYIIIPYIRVKLSVNQLDTVHKWMNITVKAAEVLFPGDQRGAEKKQYCIEFIQGQAKKYHWNIDIETIENLLESAWVSMQTSDVNKDGAESDNTGS